MARPAKQTSLLRLEKGKLYGDQRDRAALEPTSKREVRPSCPRDFSPNERKQFRAYARLLDNYGLLQGGNAGILRRLATAAVFYEKLRVDYIATGMVKVGYAMLKVGKDMDVMETTLGLPSMARAKLGSLTLAALKKKDKFFDD